MLGTITVEWEDDLRPMPDTTPGISGDNDPAWDVSLIAKRKGIIVGSYRSFWGRCVLVVMRNDGKVVEVEADRVKGGTLEG